MNIILALAIILLMGALGGKLARKYFKLPSVTGYIFMGMILGPSVFNIIDSEITQSFGPLNDVALGVLAVSIGGELKFSFLRSIWANLCRVFIAEAIITFVLVGLITTIISNSLLIGLILATLSLASAPNTTIAVFRDFRLKGDFPPTVLSLVALDNIICLLLFSIVLGVFGVMGEGGTNAGHVIVLSVILNLLFSILLGVLIGFVLKKLSLKVRSDNELLILCLGFIFLGIGISIHWGLQPLFTAMIIGLIVVNFSARSQRIFTVLQRVDPPILVAFLTLAGLKIDLGQLSVVGLLGLGYILSRFLGKIIGGYYGGRSCPNLQDSYKANLGPALTPQAGVAVGLSIMVERELPFVEGQILTVILGAVIVFEIVGPLLLKKSLYKTGSVIGD